MATTARSGYRLRVHKDGTRSLYRIKRSGHHNSMKPVIDRSALPRAEFYQAVWAEVDGTRRTRHDPEDAS